MREMLKQLAMDHSRSTLLPHLAHLQLQATLQIQLITVSLIPHLHPLQATTTATSAETLELQEA